MPRRPLIRTDEFPYHVTTRANNKEDFPLNQASAWQLFLEYLQEVQERYEMRLFAFVMMRNHIHLLVQTPQLNLDKALRYLFTEISRKMGSKSGRINHVFGGRYHWAIVQEQGYLLNAFRYIYLNPVQAGISQRAEEYPFSTILYPYLRSSPLDLDVFPGLENHTQNREAFLAWINRPLTEKHWESLRRAARRCHFQLPRGKRWKKVNRELLAGA